MLSVSGDQVENCQELTEKGRLFAGHESAELDQLGVPSTDVSFFDRCPNSVLFDIAEKERGELVAGVPQFASGVRRKAGILT